MNPNQLEPNFACNILMEFKRAENCFDTANLQYIREQATLGVGFIRHCNENGVIPWHEYLAQKVVCVGCGGMHPRSEGAICNSCAHYEPPHEGETDGDEAA